MSPKKVKKAQAKSADATNNNGHCASHNNGLVSNATAEKEVPVKGGVKPVSLTIFIDTPEEKLREEKEEGGDSRRPTEIEPRTRRVSDVIDSIGEESSQPGSPRFKSVHDQNVQISPKSTVFLPDWMSNEPTSEKRQVNDSVDAGVMKVKARDKTDAKPIGTVSEPYDVEDDEERRDVCAAMPVEKDSLEYNMSHRRRGKAIILNHTEFEMAGFSPRDGSDIDAKNLEIVLRKLHFEVIIYNNLEHAEIKTVINKLKSEEDHSDADCLLITVLSHGIKGGYVLAKDVPYPVDFLWHSFKPDVCPTLAGKPKLFLIQACRGEKLDQGVNLMRTSTLRTQTDSASSDYKIPSFADFLVAYSTVEDHFAWRNPEKGTWFIQCLCQELHDNGTSLDLLKLMTRASRRVALDFQSFNDLNPMVHDMKQVPAITTMLIRDVFFHPKPAADVIERMEVDGRQLKEA